MFVLYREKYQICAGRHRAGEMRMGAAKKRKIEVRHYIIGIAVFVVAVAVSLIIFFLASSRMIRDKSEDAMRENLLRQSDHLVSILQLHYQYLNSVAEEIGEREGFITEENLRTIAFLQKNTDLDRTALIEADGTSHYDNGVIKNVAYRRYFIEGMNGKETLSDPLESSVDQETRVVLGVPVYRGDEVIGIVGGSYNVTALSQTMLNDTFGGVGYSLIVTAEGKIIAHHGEPVYQKTFTYGENFFDFYSENYNSNDLERVQNDFSQGNQGLLELNILPQTEESRYLAYAPFGMNDWMICYVIPVSAAQDAYSFIENYETTFLGVFSLFVCLLICYIIHISGSRNRELLYYAQRDSLTGLYNKKNTEEQINAFLQEAQPEVHHAFFIMDMDCFKQINDKYGHATGDQALEAFGSLLQSYFRQSDILGRIGGDEFVVFMKHVKNAENASTRAKELLTKLHALAVGNMERPMSASIGLVMAPDEGDCYMELYQKADHALYQAKKRGKNQCVIFSREMNAKQAEE